MKVFYQTKITTLAHAHLIQECRVICLNALLSAGEKTMLWLIGPAGSLFIRMRRVTLAR
jgi:hypothetical protein